MRFNVMAMDSREGDFELWWPTPVWVHRWADHRTLNSDLETLILAKMETSSGRKRSNVGGWHSDEDLLRWPAAVVGRLRERIEHGLREIITASYGAAAVPARYSIAAWANVNREGDSNDAHDHGNHVWAGVYYVANGNNDPEAPTTGALTLYDPRVAAGRIHLNAGQFAPTRLLRPTPGTMVIFPAWLLHAVRPHTDPGLRISIAFNVAELG